MQDFLSEQKASLTEVFAGEQWLLESGLVPQTSIDTLLGYAYMQPGVANVEVIIDAAAAASGLPALVVYKIGLQAGLKRRHRWLKSLLNKNTIIAKLMALVLIKFRAPIPGMIERNVKFLAGDYLPKNFKVEVHVE